MKTIVKSDVKNAVKSVVKKDVKNDVKNCVKNVVKKKTYNLRDCWSCAKKRSVKKRELFFSCPPYF